MTTRRTRSEEETVEFGRQVATGLPSDAIVLLFGDLGSGKTTLAKGLAAGFGVADPAAVHSPTFSLVHEYPSRDGVVYHIDLYRLESAREQASIGLEEILASGRPVLIEWADRLHLRVDGGIEVRLASEGDQRIISVGDVTH